MPLNSSGPIRIGGTTVGESINLELGRTATASSNLNETNLRNLAVKASGAISLNDFRGKAAVNVSNQITINVTRAGLGGTRVVTYQLNADGITYINQGPSAFFSAVSNEWIATSSLVGLASLYEGRMDTPGGSDGILGGSAFDTWLNLGTTRQWQLSVTDDFVSRTGTVRIRNAATGQELDSALATFTVDTSI
jgi:hypothetical protein